MKKLLTTAVTVFGLSTSAHAGVILAPVSGTILAGGPGFGSINDTFNQNGLFSTYVAGVTDFDAFIGTNPLHTSVFSPNEWFSNSGTSSASVLYDLGAIVAIDRLALWNEESSGIGSLAVFGSTDGTAFTSLGVFSPTDNPVINYGADVFGLGNTSLRFVRFDMSGCPQANPGGFAACAIGEVAFSAAAAEGAVPEPSTWAMMLVGFGAIGFAMRRRQTVSTRINFA